jgi:hypothetical protein
MADVKIVVRNVGIPNKGLDIYSPETVSEYLKYQYPDYDLHETHYLGEVKSGDPKTGTQGWKVMFVLKRSAEEIYSRHGGEIAPNVVLETVSSTAKRGRHRKEA